MTGSASVLSICNRALLDIGSQSQISSLNENSAAAQACNTLYQPTYEQVARSAPWGCLRYEQQLTLYAAAQGTPENPNGTTYPLPPPPYLYSYLYPANCLQIRQLVPYLPNQNTGVPLFPVNTGAPTFLPSKGQIPYAIGYATDINNNPFNVILTNQSQAIAVYTVNNSNPQLWDSLFQQAVVSALAVFLAPALSLNLPLMAQKIQLAEKLIEQARVRDGNEGVTSQDHVPDWIRARRGATGMYWNYGRSQGFNGYDSICWPSC